MKSRHHLPSLLIGAGAATALFVLTGMSRAPVEDSPSQAAVLRRLESLETWRAEITPKLARWEHLLGATEDRSKAPPVKSPADRARSVLVVTLDNKKFQEQDARRGVYQEAIWWDATYRPVGLRKPARAVKGVVEFADLFGEVHFRLRMTINEPMKPGQTVVTKGVGFGYNQFKDDHKWMRTTDFADMTITFRASSIIYEDGTTENF